MEWKDLSDEAQGIIEWVVSPFTNFKETIEIKIGEIFHSSCPKFCGGLKDKYNPKIGILLQIESVNCILTSLVEL